MLTVLGIDIGSTTSHAVLARAAVSKDGVRPTENRTSGVELLYQSPIELTPFSGESIDSEKLGNLAKSWRHSIEGLVAINERDCRIDSTGVIVTGLAARAHNRLTLLKILREEFPEALVITAEDPRLESWIAWHGGVGKISKAHPDRYFLNLDIGGGTTNIAIGKAGCVLATGSYFIGARHLRFEGGSWVNASRFAPASNDPIQASKHYVKCLTQLVESPHREMLEPILEARYPFPPTECVITFTGGVGELIYDESLGAYSETRYGDLGVVLARAILETPLAKDARTFQPRFRARATAIGLGLANTRLSGSSIFLPNTHRLPALSVPILGRVTFNAGTDELRPLFNSMPNQSPIALQIHGAPASYRDLKLFADALRAVWASAAPDTFLILVMSHNYAKTLGAMVCGWGKSRLTLIALDEVETLGAQFVSVGSPLENTVPLSYFGLY